MPYKVIRAEIVQLEVESALTFYDSISVELGIRFEDDLQRSFSKLSKSPHNYFNLKYGYRRIRIGHFPYMIIYKIEEQTFTVKVFGVFHQHANPASIYRKIKSR